ncbi:MAG: peptidoglycan DD-metalloendopeptidase family protein [Dyella sp.]
MLAPMKTPLRFLTVGAAALLLAACGRAVVVQSSSSGYAEGSTNASPRIPGGSYQVIKGDTLYSIAFRNGMDYRTLAAWNGISDPYTIWPGQVLRLSPPGRESSRSSVVAAVPPPPSRPAPAPEPVAVAPAFEDVPPASHSAAPPAVSAAVVAAGSHPSTTPAPAAGAVTVPVAGSTAVTPPEPAQTPVVSSGPARSAGGVNWRWPADGSVFKRFQSGDAIPGIEITGKAGDPVRAAADGVVVYSGNGLVGYGELIIIKHNDSLLSAYGHNRKRLVKEGQKVSAGQQIAEMGSTGASRDELQFQIRKDGNPVDPLSYLPSR